MRTAVQIDPATATREADPTGKWEGKWHSEGTGHSGRLRAIVEPSAKSGEESDTYDVRFDAVWGGVFRFGETVRLKPRPAATQPSTYTFDDQHDAGWLGGGFYQFTGEITPDRFNCSYQGKADHGTLDMTRLAANTK